VVGDCDFSWPVGVVIAGAGSAALRNPLALADVVELWVIRRRVRRTHYGPTLLSSTVR
jgi:hypothetical protein